MMRRHGLIHIMIILAGAILCGLNLMPESLTHASSQRVLIVYDAQNTGDGGAKRIDVLQRSLTSLDLHVKTVAQSDYQQGMLSQGHYSGVITVINWPAVGITNKRFLADRQAYHGIKLHIGGDLTQQEATAMGAKRVIRYQQQLTLKTTGDSTSLPFLKTITLLTHLPSHVHQYGHLVTQSGTENGHAYGVTSNQNGYLPFLVTSGDGLITAQRLLADLFSQSASHHPLLTITKVTPYSDLSRLVQLSRYLNRHHIRFAVSAVSVAENAELAAYRQYTKRLRQVELNGGVIFLQTPKIGGASAASGNKLNQLMTGELVDLANQAVFPVGISSAGYWNQDIVLRKNALSKASSWVLLPNKAPTYLKQDNNAAVAKTTYMAMPFHSVAHQPLTNLPLATALTINTPDSRKRVRIIEQQVTQTHFHWADLQTNGFQGTIHVGTTALAYKNGHYYLNGHRQRVTHNVASPYKTPKPVATQPLFKRFFKVQGCF
ncbi:hypothetical protein [Secundilactobacillus paracollinoides]|uniref:hypothetical protein n=1 Tax=Secundilactobacillus paracollinoides TaxID=240427 RepID=UPI0006D1E98E|nr:hypothetical protein [Secundilactobacillus paracollinoides]